ncbi:hypothetical protein FOCC_FOCC012142 [Frankliniella occidentalis]|nr:hypothetical protein FOCC_FOCC012142 [Frankliniella occidentalis]
MNLKCDSCLLKFDLDSHRPKSLPCGHTICKECVENPALGTKCPTCKKAFEKRRPQNLPDTAIVVRLLEDEEAPPSKKPKTENPNLAQQLVSASSPQTPQRVQIIKHRDGKIQVKGLMPGQQLVQMPDGKLHVLDTIPPPGQQITTIGQRNANSDLVQKTSSIVRAIQGIPQTPATPVFVHFV